jgi:hypothetical protein
VHETEGVGRFDAAAVALLAPPAEGGRNPSQHLVSGAMTMPMGDLVGVMMVQLAAVNRVIQRPSLEFQGQQLLRLAFPAATRTWKACSSPGVMMQGEDMLVLQAMRATLS